MKKIYTLPLAVALSLTASAMPTAFSGNLDLSTLSALVADDTPGTPLSESACNGVIIEKKASANANDASSSIEGVYTITLGDYYMSNSVGQFEAECTLSLYKGHVQIECGEFVSKVFAQYTPQTGAMYFYAQGLGPVTVDGTTYYVATEPFRYDEESESCVRTDFTAYYDAESDAITIPEGYGILWGLYPNEEYEEEELIQHAKILEFESIERYDPNQGWSDAGIALFQDGWLLPVFDIDQLDYKNWYPVEIQVSDENDALYRLVDPYRGLCPIADKNESNKTGYIVFDISDPDHVVFEAVEAGFANADKGISQFYCSNILSSLAGGNGFTPAELVERYGDRLPYTYVKDHVVYLDNGYNESTKTMNDACFGVQNDPYAGNGWQNGESSSSLDMTTRIYMPGSPICSGIGKISEADEAPARYFTLQGIEIDSPVPGQIVICRKGGSSFKTIVR